MKNYLTLFLIGAVINVADVSAQTTTTPSNTNERKVTVYTSHEFTLTEISGFRVVNERLNGTPLPAPRYHIRGVYTPLQQCNPTSGMVCTMSHSISEPASLILREWDFAADGIQDRILNICRRTIENARPGALVKLKGKVAIDRSGSDALVYLQSITSCVMYPAGT
jgi:hypothetical protein